MPSNPRDPKMSEEAQVELILLRPDPVEEGPDTLRCPACGTGVYYNDGICSACGQIYCPGCGHPLDEGDDETCPSCGLVLTFDCPGCKFPVAAGSRVCPECGVLFVRRCPSCETRILDAPEAFRIPTSRARRTDRAVARFTKLIPATIRITRPIAPKSIRSRTSPRAA